MKLKDYMQHLTDLTLHYRAEGEVLGAVQEGFDDDKNTGEIYQWVLQDYIKP